MAKKQFVPRGRKNFQPLTDDEKRQRAALLLQPVKSQAEMQGFETRFTKHKTETDEVNGVLGPFDVTRSTTGPYSGARDSYVRRIWRRSKTKRHRAPTAFGMNSGFNKVRPVSGTPYGYDVASNYEMTIASQANPNDALASNKALSRLMTKIRDDSTASAAVTLAEWHRSHDMIVTRGTQLLNVAKSIRALRRGDVRHLGGFSLNVPSGFRPKSKGAANLWLEYHFGWSPLVQDIYNAVKVLSAEPPSNRVRATGRWLEPIDQTQGSNPVYRRIGTYECKTLCGAEVYVSNPNMALANQLGFINPATVAWELVPFSFLVDWFLPVGRFLESFSDLLGYSVHYPFTSTKRTVLTNLRITGTGADTGRVTDYANSCCSVNRSLSLPTYKLRTIPFKGFSAARGATAIALLVQQFLSMKAEPLVYSRHLR